MKIKGDYVVIVGPAFVGTVAGDMYNPSFDLQMLTLVKRIDEAQIFHDYNIAKRYAKFSGGKICRLKYEEVKE